MQLNIFRYSTNTLMLVALIYSYVEPLARLANGMHDQHKLWLWWLQGMPHGLPSGSDQGLDDATGGVFIGEAHCFCLLGDIEIHRRTDNRFGQRKDDYSS